MLVYLHETKMGSGDLGGLYRFCYSADRSYGLCDSVAVLFGSHPWRNERFSWSDLRDSFESAAASKRIHPLRELAHSAPEP